MVQLLRLEAAYLSKSDFLKMLQKFKAKTDEDLIAAYFDACTVQAGEQKMLDVRLMANHYLHRHPRPRQ
jgi:DNA topoisomerase IB